MQAVYSLRKSAHVLSSGIALHSTLTTTKRHKVRCSVPRYLVQVVKLVGDLWDGGSEDCLHALLASSHIVTTENPGVTNVVKRHKEHSEQQRYDDSGKTSSMCVLVVRCDLLLVIGKIGRIRLVARSCNVRHVQRLSV